MFPHASYQSAVAPAATHDNVVLLVLEKLLHVIVFTCDDSLAKCYVLGIQPYYHME